MTDYEFVRKVVGNGGHCLEMSLSGDANCRTCPIKGNYCTVQAVLERAKAWLENYDKDCEFASLVLTSEDKQYIPYPNNVLIIKEQEMEGIKVTVEEGVSANKTKYPMYMKCFKGENKGTIVCFVKSDVGFAFGKPWVGTIWDKSMFIPFHGKITIEVE